MEPHQENSCLLLVVFVVVVSTGFIFTKSKLNSMCRKREVYLFTYTLNITKTRLFKYTEYFTTKKKKENFQIKILILFIFLLKT